MWGITKPVQKKKMPDYQTLNRLQRIDEFDKLANNRLVMGAFRYGLIQDQNFDSYDLISECEKRLLLFRKDGNLEHLIDAGNMLRLRFFWGRKKGEKFQAIDDGVHSKKIKE